MKKLITALVACLLIASPVLAVAVPVVDVDMDVGSGTVSLTTNGFDSSAWHPNAVGETNSFVGMGGFTGTYTAYEGSYGALSTYAHVNSYSGGADLVMTDTQNFNVLSANHINNVVGSFYAHASGNDNQVAMNLKSIGSMYVWSEATDPYWSPALQGSLIEKSVSTTQNSILKTNLYLGVTTTGLATMSNSNIWGWTNGETGTSSTNYGGEIRTVSATGNGAITQAGFGANSLTFNGFTFGAGTASFSGSFTGGMSGTYSMSSS